MVIQHLLSLTKLPRMERTLVQLTRREKAHAASMPVWLAESRLIAVLSFADGLRACQLAILRLQRAPAVR